MKFITEHSSAKNVTIGGKAENLFVLVREGFAVPEFIVIPKEEGLSFIPEHVLRQNDFEAIKKCISDYIFPESFTASVLEEFPGAVYFSVRSSAADEDGGQHSFAGQFESELFVTKETLTASIKKVWLSAYTDRVRLYRENNGIHSKHGIAVIIQRMLDPQVSGVAFGVNPASGDRNEKVISAVYGLGEGIVSGDLDADNFFVKNNSVRSQIVAKKERIVFDLVNGHGTVKENVPVALQEKAALSDDEAVMIAGMLDRLRAIYKRPQDIEFAIGNKKLFLLQSRPVTTTGNLPDPEGEYIVWDNSNIIESYPGLSSPLTFSFIRKMYEAVYIQFSAIMGISEKEIAAHSST
ncbi:MAG TPA: PEP/pyruvate-binding domain-containing protein, partial [Bacteroidia bacterium]|nr:PEP/pyruvate-binding domain-containing protein [Bacteroidia bacterium]